MFVRCLETAELTLYLQVIDYDDAAPSVTLKTGEKHYADIVVAVDGMLPCDAVCLFTPGVVYIYIFAIIFVFVYVFSLPSPSTSMFSSTLLLLFSFPSPP